jgi:predicted GTPase
MNKRDTLDEVVRIAASVGAPAVMLIVALSIVGASGVAGGAALTAALALLGGPGGIPVGIMVLTFVGGVSAALASHGLEALLVAIYNRRIETSDDPEIVDVLVREVESIPLLRNSQKRTITSALTRTFSILLVGRTGTGKSSTINSLLGREVAAVGGLIPVTNKIQYFDCPINDAVIRLYDTPGLCDSADMSNDDAYIASIKATLPSIDLVLFITPLNETRVSRDERVALRSLSAAIGKHLWENMIVVFTFACSSLPGDSLYADFVEERVKAFRNFVTELSAEKVSRELPFVPVDNTKHVCPDNREWIPELFTLIIEHCSSSGIYPFVQALAADVGANDNDRDTGEGQQNESADATDGHRRINLDDDQQERVKKGMKRSVFVGAIIGAATAVAAMVISPIVAVAGVPAIILGGMSGAFIGFWRRISKK